MNQDAGFGLMFRWDRDTDWFSKIDPYVRVAYGWNVAFSKVFAEGGRKVNFEFTAKFPEYGRGYAGFDISVWDADSMTQDDLIGCYALNGPAIEALDLDSGAKDLEIDLMHKKTSKSAGQLKVRLWREQRDQNTELIPELRFEVNLNRRAGIMRKLADGGAYKSFTTYQVQLWEVDACFAGIRQPWNREYKAAQMIFSDTQKANAIRSGIRIQHSALYDKNRKTTGMSKIVYAKGAQEFIDRVLEKTDLLYTYVVTEDSKLHFSQTGKSFGQDILSKHALHNNARPMVIYSGEFFVDCKSQPGNPRLVFDNNSGTYSPDKQLLPNLLELLERNFGRNKAVALDRMDPELARLIELNNILR